MPAVHQLARIRHAEPIARRRAIPVAGVDTSRSAA
jgi:hypothetical protein